MAGAAAPAAGAAGAAAGGGGAAAGQEQQQGFSIGGLLRMAIFWYMISNWMKGGSNNQQSANNNNNNNAVSTGPGSPHRPLWAPGTMFDLYVIAHTNQTLLLPPTPILPNDPALASSDLSSAETAVSTTLATLDRKSFEKQFLLYTRPNLYFDDGKSLNYESVGKNVTLPDWAMDALIKNETLYTHTFFVMKGHSYWPTVKKNGKMPTFKYTAGSFSSRAPGVVYKGGPLNVYRPAPKDTKKKNLLSASSDQTQNDTLLLEQPKQETKQIEASAQFDDWSDSQDELIDEDALEKVDAAKKKVATSSSSSSTDRPLVSFWRPHLSLRLIPDWSVFPNKNIPSEMAAEFEVDPKTDQYFPVVYYDYFWTLREHLIQINETLRATPLNLTITYSPLSLIYWRLEVQMEQSWATQREWGATEEKDNDMLKKMFMDTNPYLLALTFAVSLLHMVFDFLAFKNDILFWKDAKSMKGLSTRSILLNTFSQIIIFLYLFDNDTSWMILISTFVGIIIEIWKIQKAMVVRIDKEAGFPYIRVLNKNLSEDKREEDKTPEEKELEEQAKYDAEAMVYLSYALYPLIVCYAIYSLIYEEHKSWYSFILGVLTGCVYTFGFIMMCPQLYLNYKLKSVAHLPWRMLTYKALNTFIDDLFAFIITMPTLHRLSCFRDDIIFFIFLYQKWIYRTDYNRVNEFGCTVLLSDEEKRKIEEEDRKRLGLPPLADEEEKSVTEEKKADEPAAASTEESSVEEETSTENDENVLRKRTAASTSEQKSIHDDVD